MVVGILEVRLGIRGARSLKDKRRVTRSLKDRLSVRHNISIAEVGDLEVWQAATFGIAMVANEPGFVQSCLDKIVDEIRSHPEASLIDYDLELL